MTFDEAAALNTAFLQDIADNIQLAGCHTGIATYVAFAPSGSEEFFRRILPPPIGLIDACQPSLGDCLLSTSRQSTRARLGRVAQRRQPDPADGAPGRALIDAELDELRVSFDAANAESYRAIRGKNYFHRILKNVRAFRELQEREGRRKPHVSAWLTGLRETVVQLPDFVRVAAEAGVTEVYLQRLVFFAENAIGMARPDQALYEQLSRGEAAYIDRAAALAASLGITFSASGATAEPGMS